MKSRPPSLCVVIVAGITLLAIFNNPTRATAQSTMDGRATVHVFPQFADGRLPDGSYYRSSLLFSNTDTRLNNCLFRTHGGVVPELKDTLGNRVITDFLSFRTPGLSSDVVVSTGRMVYGGGYATLSCDYEVTAQVLFSLYNSGGIKQSEATIFAAPRGQIMQLIADQREGARLGIAIASDSTTPVDYQITAYTGTGATMGSKTITIPALSNAAKFLDELIPQTEGTLSTILVRVSGTSLPLPVYVIGLRFSGSVFTTVPATIRLQ